MDIDNIQGETFSPKTCLLPMVTPFSREILKLADLYKVGILPLAGGYYDQPNIIIESLNVVSQRRAYNKVIGHGG